MDDLRFSLNDDFSKSYTHERPCPSTTSPAQRVKSTDDYTARLEKENAELKALIDDLYLSIAAPAYNKKINEGDFPHIAISDERWERVKTRIKDLPNV